MLKLGRVTKVNVLFLMLVFVFNFDLFKFSAAILEKGLLDIINSVDKTKLSVDHKPRTDVKKVYDQRLPVAQCSVGQCINLDCYASKLKYVFQLEGNVSHVVGQNSLIP